MATAKKKMGRPKSTNPKGEVLYVRITPEVKAECEEAAAELGFTNVIEYVRTLIRRDSKQVLREKKARMDGGGPG